MKQIYYFSATNTGFYAESLKGSVYELSGAWPADAVELSDDDYKTYSGQAPDGKILGSGDGGMPAWVDIPPSTAEELIAMAERERNSLRTIADAEIAWRQDAVDAGIATDEETAALAEWKKYRVLLMRVDTAKPVWPTLPRV